MHTLRNEANIRVQSCCLSTVLAQDHFYSDFSCICNSLQNTSHSLMMSPGLLTWEIASLHDEGCEKILTEGSGWAKLRISELTTRRRFFFLAWWEFEHPRPPAHWGRQERFGAQVRGIGCWVLLRLVLLATSNLGSLARSSFKGIWCSVLHPHHMRKALGSIPSVSQALRHAKPPSPAASQNRSFSNPNPAQPGF